MTGTGTVRKGKTRPTVQLSDPPAWLCCVSMLGLVSAAA